jgi:hypothetical protein
VSIDEGQGKGMEAQWHGLKRSQCAKNLYLDIPTPLDLDLRSPWKSVTTPARRDKTMRGQYPR